MESNVQNAMSIAKEAWYKVDGLYDFYAKSVGLNLTNILVLELLSDPTEIYTQKDVCEKLGLPKQLVNSIIKSLWEQRHVELREARDRRNKDIIVTDNGMEYIIGILKPMEDAEAVAWSSFSAEEIANLAKIMEKFVEVFGDALKKIPQNQADS
ncbi:MAG: MarR family winged helix-turn-helix transcriptional regulator [Defluviitaleaceae bacterium]|nr:MarR family winged helix-turn-helix transcriptional regulator [Defluviitaleaceae bacterium]